MEVEREKHDKEIRREQEKNEKEIQIEKERTERCKTEAKKEFYIEAMRPRVVADQTRVSKGWISHDTNTERIHRAPFEEPGWEQLQRAYEDGDGKNMAYTSSHHQHQQTGRHHQQNFDDEL